MLELLTAEERLWITDPYLSMPILTQSLMATRDGVDVRATNDIAWIGRASRAGYRQFLEAGVRIFEYGGPMIHAKTIVADGWWSKVETNLNQQPGCQLGDRPGSGRSRFCRADGGAVRGRPLNAREVRLEGSGQHLRVRPVRWTTAARGRRGAGPLSRVGSPSSEAGPRFKPTSMPSPPQPALPCSECR